MKSARGEHDTAEVLFLTSPHTSRVRDPGKIIKQLEVVGKSEQNSSHLIKVVLETFIWKVEKCEERGDFWQRFSSPRIALQASEFHAFMTIPRHEKNWTCKQFNLDIKRVIVGRLLGRVQSSEPLLWANVYNIILCLARSAARSLNQEIAFALVESD